MKRRLIAAFTGVAAGLLIAVVPLWRQHVRAAQASSAPPSPPSAETLPEKVDAARHHGGTIERELRAARLVETFTAAQCRAAADAAVASGRKTLLCGLLCRWASLNGAEAFAWLDDHLEVWYDVLPDAASEWAVSDPAASADWMERTGKLYLHRPNSDYHPANIKGPAWLTLMQHDLRAAIRVAGNHGIDLPGGIPMSRNQLRPAIRTTAAAGAVGAEILAHPEWLSKLEPGQPLYLLAALRECWQEIDPDGWDRWAAAHPEAAAKSGSHPMHPGIEFLRNPDRGTAATQILQSAPPEKLEETSEAVMKLWVDEDMEAAGHWLNTCPDGPMKNAAALAYALQAVKEDPAAALRWADAIGDPAARARTQRRVFTAWHDANPAAAAAWLPQSGWSRAQMAAARDIMTARPPPR